MPSTVVASRPHGALSKASSIEESGLCSLSMVGETQLAQECFGRVDAGAGRAQVRAMSDVIHNAERAAWYVRQHVLTNTERRQQVVARLQDQRGRGDSRQVGAMVLDHPR